MKEKTLLKDKSSILSREGDSIIPQSLLFSL